MKVKSYKWEGYPSINPTSLHREHYKWLEEFQPKWLNFYVFNHDCKLIITTDKEEVVLSFKAGYAYDRASVPFTVGRVRRDLASATVASLVHDVFYNVPVEDHGFTAREVHTFLKDIMIIAGASRFTAMKYYLAVLLATPFTYQRRNIWDDFIKDYVKVDRHALEER